MGGGAGSSGSAVFEKGGWSVRVENRRMLNSQELQNLEEEMRVPCLPEMVFGLSGLELAHRSGVGLRFDVRGALGAWAHDKPTVKVWYSAKWASQKSSEAKSGPEYDWTFTTDYTGTLVPQGVTAEKTEETIDLELLKIPEPMLFVNEVVLFEDELADNGTALFNVKVRVMEKYLYCLARFWLRVDDVLFRVHDTRIYHDYSKDYFLQEFQAREDTYQHLTEIGKLPTDPTQLAEPQAIIPLLQTTRKWTEKISLRPLSAKDVGQTTGIEGELASLSVSSSSGTSQKQ